MLTLWRAKTLETKEPETLRWINSFKKEDVLYDIGANIGLYSLYAAKCAGCSVIAFEPEAQNYALLNKNVFLNHLSDPVKAFCIALSDKTGFDNLYLSEYVIGGAMHNLGEEVNYNHEKFSSPYTQGAVSFSLDDVVKTQSFPEPNHIKIDVDGLEAKIIQGAFETLKKSSVKSVLLELNTELDCDQKIFHIMRELGFEPTDEYYRAHDQVADKRFINLKNYIFVRR